MNFLSNVTNFNATPTTDAASGLVVNYCYFDYARDTAPKYREMIWDSFCETFSRHQPQSRKDGLAWSPCRYLPGTTRSKANVESVCMAVLDIDDGTSVEELQARLPGIAHLVYSTFSHTPEHPKYRVVIPLTSPVDSKDWPAFWGRLNLFMGEHLDPATKDASRLYYAPSCPIGSKDHFFRRQGGMPLDPDSLTPPPTPAPATPVANVVRMDSYRDPEQLGNAQELAEVVRRCQFMQDASDPAQQNGLSEPLWMAMVSNACRFEDSDWIHEASCDYDDYDAEETDKRILRYRASPGPITCKVIQELGYENCPKGGCKLPSKKATKAPAGLRVWYQTGQESQKQDKIALEQARAFADHKYGDCICRVHDFFYVYGTGYWQRISEDGTIKHQLVRFLETSGAKRIDPQTVKAAFEMLALDYHREGEMFQRSGLICLENGTLDPLTGEMLEHNPDHLLTGHLPITWDAEAACPRWLQTLDEIFAPDEDKADKISFLQEWFGYCLIPDTSQHKFLWLVGRGGNGKSVVLEMLESLLGMENISHAQIERLDRAAVRAELEGKLVNISSEMSAEATVSDGYLKQIVGGDTIEAERKFKAPFSFKPYARLIGATNELPRLLDHSDGFGRRAVILGFNRTFTEAEQDKTLLSRLRQETAGILRWAITGLQQLKARGNFILPASSRQVVLEYRKESDPVQIFLEECMEEDNHGITPNDLYSDFTEWCRSNGFQPVNKIRLGKRLHILEIGSRASGGQKFWLIKPKAPRHDDRHLNYYWASGR